jgi:hypothetical protein
MSAAAAAAYQFFSGTTGTARTSRARVLARVRMRCPRDFVWRSILCARLPAGPHRQHERPHHCSSCCEPINRTSTTNNILNRPPLCGRASGRGEGPLLGRTARPPPQPRVTQNDLPRRNPTVPLSGDQRERKRMERVPRASRLLQKISCHSRRCTALRCWYAKCIPAGRQAGRQEGRRIRNRTFC